jgi:osmotically-inducible protein OsmY
VNDPKAHQDRPGTGPVRSESPGGAGRWGEPGYLAAHIQERLSSHAHELGIQVDVRGEVVYLRGEVVTEERRREVEEAARGAAEGRTVRNEVSVTPVREPDGEETLS